jgi:hypothetical protein
VLHLCRCSVVVHDFSFPPLSLDFLLGCAPFLISRSRTCALSYHALSAAILLVDQILKAKCIQRVQEVVKTSPLLKASARSVLIVSSSVATARHYVPPLKQEIGGRPGKFAGVCLLHAVACLLILWLRPPEFDILRRYLSCASLTRFFKRAALLGREGKSLWPLTNY